ncbi:MAG TPA: hypothetical protein VLR90_01300, partial [Blastocatellia bacterium]|nr:hypothetical protein [Blastocatellia bacterium]
FGSRMCVPPFFDPSNPNIDPVILRQVGALGMKMATDLAAAGHHGIVTNSTYDTWWHGGLRTAPYYHNAVGILTEAASVNIATPMQIKREQLRSPTRGLADPLVAATNFPDPWQGGTWTMRDIVNMELITTRTALEEASLHRDELIRNFVGAATRAIEAGKTDAPYAYIVPAAQHDKPTAEQMINILIQQGVEVHRAKSDFTIDGKKYDKGSYCILLAQPYRANVKCLFEAQKYPDRRIYPGGPAEPPYDVAGWTLPMQMGVDYAEAGKRFDAEMEKIDSTGLEQSTNWTTAKYVREKTTDGKTLPGIFVSPNENKAYEQVNSILNMSGGTVGAPRVWRLKKETQVNGESFPAGTFVEQREVLMSATKKKSSANKQPQPISLYGISAPADLIVSPRLAIYQSWSPSMDEGWTRWVLEQFGFDYKRIHDADVRAGNLKDKFDVILLPDQNMQQIITGNRAGSYPEEYTGGIGDEGVAALKSFVEAGGVLICLDSASELALKKFDLPVKNALEGTKRDQFYAPGSIFRAVVDTQHPIAYGMPSEANLYFVSGARRGRPEPDSMPAPEATTRADGQPRAESNTASQRPSDAGILVSAFAFEITDPQRARSVARYVDNNPLRSGWLLGPQFIAGKSALVDASLGKGRVVLFGFRTQHRAQTWGTFKFLFNAILLGGTKSDVK